MPGWAQRFVAGIALVTLVLSGAAIYLRVGVTGLKLAAGLSLLLAFPFLFEGVGSLLITALIGWIRSRKPTKEDAEIIAALEEFRDALRAGPISRRSESIPRGRP